MQIGTLPFKYLGVPISAKKLSVLDCSMLVEKIVARIRALGSRHLSYGGRLALIKSVLNNLHSYWARIFILPKTILKKIDDICRNFLWRGSYHYMNVPLIAWDQICKKKECGGLGIKRLYEFNIASVAKYVWWLANKKDHLWVKWISGVYLRGQNWAVVQASSSATWAWKRICKVRDIMLSGFCGDWWQRVDNPYSVKQGYSWLRPDGDVVQWRHFAWNRLCLPRHNIIC
ncbi:hypothetical protein RND81_07G061700 [Saponaria officinalis]|uniref:Uncharacterized protein n=1 Tax=Saponaria officinalis TaxID=3572 RepID=A0AAW1JPC5_SAPOF